MNGFGPWWLPDWARGLLTRAAMWFFVSASWDRHDEGYRRKSPSRWRCDWLFLRAMLADAMGHRGVKRVVSIALAVGIWAIVRLGGWASYGYTG